MTYEFETWRQSDLVEDYLVSDHGRVMRKPYSSHMPHGGERQYGGQPHHGQTSDCRKIFVYKGHTYKVHQLVCSAFNGPKPWPTAVCMHLDEDFENNRPVNLAWSAQKENLNAIGFVSCQSSSVRDRGLDGCYI